VAPDPSRTTSGRRCACAGGLYFDWQEFPLASRRSMTCADPWPDPADPARFQGLRERVLAMRASTDRALFGMPCGHDLFNQLLACAHGGGAHDLVANQTSPRPSGAADADICTSQELYLREWAT